MLMCMACISRAGDVVLVTLDFQKSPLSYLSEKAHKKLALLAKLVRSTCSLGSHGLYMYVQCVCC